MFEKIFVDILLFEEQKQCPTCHGKGIMWVQVAEDDVAAEECYCQE
jgi:hypothetical protein